MDGKYIDKLRFWCNKVLPLVYDETLSYYELLCKVVGKLNEVISQTNELSENVKEYISEWLDTDEGRTTIENVFNELIDENYGNLLTRVDALEDNLGDFIDEVRPLNSLKNVKTLLVGNSFAAGTGSGSNRGWPYYFQLASGCDAEYISQNGGDFGAPGNANADYPDKTYSQALSTWVGTKSEDERKLFKLVVVAGGRNDLSINRNPGGIASIISGMDAFVSLCRTALPNAKIFIIPCTSTADFDSMEQLFCLCNGWAQHAASLGCGTCTNSIFWFLKKIEYDAGDNTHLNDTGYALLGKYILSVVNGWDGSIVERVSGSATESGVEGTFRAYRENNIVHVYAQLTMTTQNTIFPFARMGQYGRPTHSQRAAGAFIYGSPRSFVPIVVQTDGYVTLQNIGQTMPSEEFTLYTAFDYELTM